MRLKKSSWQFNNGSADTIDYLLENILTVFGGQCVANKRNSLGVLWLYINIQNWVKLINHVYKSECLIVSSKKLILINPENQFIERLLGCF